MVDGIVRAGVPVGATRDMEVAVGEAPSKVYQHAYAGGVGPVFVEVTDGAGAVSVLVRDEGSATEPPVVPRRLSARSGIGGRGLYMIGRLVDDIRLKIGSSGHGVSIQMTSYLEIPDRWWRTCV